MLCAMHEDVMIWKRFPYHWSFIKGVHRYMHCINILPLLPTNQPTRPKGPLIQKVLRQHDSVSWRFGRICDFLSAIKNSTPSGGILTTRDFLVSRNAWITLLISVTNWSYDAIFGMLVIKLMLTGMNGITWPSSGRFVNLLSQPSASNLFYE